MIKQLLFSTDQMHLWFLSKYSQTCIMWPIKGTVKYGHVRQVVA